LKNTSVIGYIRPPCANDGACNVGKSNMLVNKVIDTGSYSSMHDSFLKYYSQVIDRRSNPELVKKGLTKISNDMPEAGGGGASAEGVTNDSTNASNDDDGGDGDGDPDPERRKRNPPPSSSGKHRNVTATADGLLWSLPTLKNAIGLSRSNIYQQIQAGKFPAPLKIGRSSRWLASEIHAWVNTQACARSSKTAG
jgi:predicted DNA-binding transcriptional regulator AlpA